MAAAAGEPWFKAMKAMRKRLVGQWLPPSAAVAIMACSGQAHAVEARYTCSSGAELTAVFSPPGATAGSVALTFGAGHKIVLPQVMSADGGRYADTDVEFWIKGRSATLTRAGHAETCSTK
jgi:membrane-bound inhibitor of C-type lysozyme